MRCKLKDEKARMFQDFRAALLGRPGASSQSWWQTEGLATQILEQVLRLESVKANKRDGNFVRLRTKHKSKFIDALTEHLPANERNTSAADAPLEFRCSISMDVMVEPVVARDGFSYDRELILDWFRSTPGQPPRSPMTGLHLPSADIVSHNVHSGFHILSSSRSAGHPS